jgi:hypothetical protein
MSIMSIASVVESYRSSVAATSSKRGRFAPEHIAKGPIAAAIAKRAKAREAYAGIAAVMRELRDAGLTFAAIAAALNAEGHTTRYGSQFDAANVLRIIRLHAD